MRFDLIDRVLDRRDDGLTAVKSVTAAEEYLADHFPGFPVLPGVMMLETLVQAARRFVAEGDGAPDRPLVVRDVRNVKYGSFVQPGQTLTVDVTLRRHDAAGGAYEFQGVGRVDEQVAVQGRFRLEAVGSEAVRGEPTC
ncbi:MAG: 3-hydroxyacyl-ACP dehydratase FabZ family protein [Phycisphaeraceae bacterium]